MVWSSLDNTSSFVHVFMFSHNGCSGSHADKELVQCIREEVAPGESEIAVQIALLTKHIFLCLQVMT